MLALLCKLYAADCLTHLDTEGINRKRVQRLMGRLGLAGMAPGPNTSRAYPQHTVYPYLLRGLAVTRPNKVWSTDITYLRLPRGFVYLVAGDRLVLAPRAGMACLEYTGERVL